MFLRHLNTIPFNAVQIINHLPCYPRCLIDLYLLVVLNDAYIAYNTKTSHVSCRASICLSIRVWKLSSYSSRQFMQLQEQMGTHWYTKTLNSCKKWFHFSYWRHKRLTTPHRLISRGTKMASPPNADLTWTLWRLKCTVKWQWQMF